MAGRVRRTHGPAFKAKVASAAIEGERTLADLAQQHDAHANQVTAWKAQLLDGAAGVFGAGTARDDAAPAVGVRLPCAKVGALAVEDASSSGALGRAGLLSAERRSTPVSLADIPLGELRWVTIRRWCGKRRC